MNPRGGKTNQVNIVGAYVMFDKPYLYVDVGSTFTLQVSIKNLPHAMNSFDLTVTWNPSLVELTNIVEVGEEESRPWDTYYSNPPWSGHVNCWGEGQPWSSDAFWFTLTFRCLGTGTSIISVDVGHIVGQSGVLASDPFAIYYNQQQPTQREPVGGVTLPTNKLEIVTPYLELAGLVISVSTVVVVKRRRD